MSNFLDDLDRWVLDAIEKKAEDEPTSHPSQNVDDGNMPASTGERASENESDVKAEIPADSVNEATGSEAEGPGRGENNPTTEIGTKAAPTGEAPDVETESVKEKPEDPGTSHPAKATMGEKYSAAQLRNLADEILADIAVSTAATKSAAEMPPELKENAEEMKTEEKKKCEKCGESDCKCESEKSSSTEIEQAKAAGREAAELVASQLELAEQAQAQVSPEAVVSDIQKSAAFDAQNVVDYLAGFTTKLAEFGIEEMAAEMPQDSGEEVIEETSDAMAPAEAAPVAEEAAVGGDDVDAVVEALVEAGVTPDELLELAEGSEGEAPVAEEAAAVPEMAEEAVAEEVAPKMASKSWNKMSGAQKKAALMDALYRAAQEA